MADARDPGRPDADALLASVNAATMRAQRARFKLYFGAAPGVGKTYAMLEDAQRLRAAGVDVVVGCIETHGRSDTAALLPGLSMLPARTVEHRGITLDELDLDAALARRPKVILIDELAHTNAPGSRHPKRWDDVLELLAAGIDVNATLNVQHLDSLGDVIAQVTGVRVKETVPNAVLERADEVELIDLAPEALRDRLQAGKVYKADAAARALDGFFQRGNLLALRELALRTTAERVDADVLAHRQAHQIAATWSTRERLLVAVGPGPGSAQLVRATRRIADGQRAPWTVATVAVLGQPPLGQADQQRLEAHLRQAEQLGANIARLTGNTVSEALLEHARSHNITRIVVGKPTHARWRDRLRGSLLDELIRGSGTIDVHVIGPDDDGVSKRAPRPARAEAMATVLSSPWAYLGAVLGVIMVTALGLVTEGWISLPDISMLYLLAIMLAALAGRGAALLAAAVSVMAFDFCFVAPRWNFAIADLRYLVTFGVMFVVGVATGTLVVRLRRQELAAVERERRTAALLAFSRELAPAASDADVAAALASQLEDAFGAPAAVMVHDPRDGLMALAGLPPLSAQELTVARWALEHVQEAGAGTATLPAARVLALPLVVGEQAVAVVTLQRAVGQGALPGDARYLLDGLLRQAALALSRSQLAAMARDSAVAARAEELRASLLATVGHDLRTPLAVITGAASELQARIDLMPASARDTLVDTVLVESQRLERVLANLLELTRAEAGLEPRRQWVLVEELVGACLTRMVATLGDSKIVVDVPANIWVPIDPVLLEQVLLNLLDNAHKHGRPPLEIRARRVGGGAAAEVELTLRDHGDGVPPEYAARAFDKFERGPNPRAPGVGLGLAVCRAIVTAHGGRLTLEAPLDGTGALFRVRLPAATADLPAPPSINDDVTL